MIAKSLRFGTARYLSFGYLSFGYLSFGYLAFGAAVIAISMLDAAIVEACPNCKDTLAHNGGRMQYGYALSILLMIAAPLAILTGWFVAIYRLLRLARQQSPTRQQA